MTDTGRRISDADGEPRVPTAPTGPEQGADDFSRLALEMHEAETVDETVQAVVEFALQALSCDFAGVALHTAGGRPEVPAVTDPTVAEIFQFQMASGDGPLAECMQARTKVVVPDTTLDTPWPEWAKKVRELGVRSVLDVPLWTGSGTIGVLELYSKRTDAFGPDEEAVAYILARHAAVAVATARREENLRVAVDARKLVGQAMGILMERYKLNGDQAFQVLRRYSQDTNTKLREVAQQLIDSRRLPDR